MPQKPLRHCVSPGCSALTRTNKCDKHRKQAEQAYESNRGTATERGYDATWARVRIRKLNESPLCERCLQVNVVVSALLVHHRDRNPRNNNLKNLEALCQIHHDQEHKNERWSKWNKKAV